MANLWDTASEDSGWKHAAAIFTPSAGDQVVGKWSISTDEAKIAQVRQTNPDFVIQVVNSVDLKERLLLKYPTLPGFTFLIPEQTFDGYAYVESSTKILVSPRFIGAQDPRITCKNFLQALSDGCQKYGIPQINLTRDYFLVVPPKTDGQHQTLTDFLSSKEIKPHLKLIPNKYACSYPYVNYIIINDTCMALGNTFIFSPEKTSQVYQEIIRNAERIYQEGTVSQNLLLAIRKKLSEAIGNHLTKMSGTKIKEARYKFSCTFTRRNADVWADIEECIRWAEICKIELKLYSDLLEMEPFLPALLKKEGNTQIVAKWLQDRIKEEQVPEIEMKLTKKQISGKKTAKKRLSNKVTSSKDQ